jgi:hypothetical protein
MCGQAWQVIWLSCCHNHVIKSSSHQSKSDFAYCIAVAAASKQPDNTAATDAAAGSSSKL